MCAPILAEIALMQLYYSPGACSLASHIALTEAGAKFGIVKVNLKDKVTETGKDYSAINPKGYVPALLLDSGELVTENTALLGYIGELDPKGQLLPKSGTVGNLRVREWLGYISSELHKQCSPLFRPGTPEATIQYQRELLARRIAYIEQQLQGKSYLTGEEFTVADSYLFTVLNWAGRLQLDLAPWPNVRAFMDRVRARPAVQSALGAEGLLKPAA
jgi:glutathione S-transferase